jgi:hypothetical protein
MTYPRNTQVLLQSRAVNRSGNSNCRDSASHNPPANSLSRSHIVLSSLPYQWPDPSYSSSVVVVMEENVRESKKTLTPPSPICFAAGVPFPSHVAPHPSTTTTNKTNAQLHDPQTRVPTRFYARENPANAKSECTQCRTSHAPNPPTLA